LGQRLTTVAAPLFYNSSHSLEFSFGDSCYPTGTLREQQAYIGCLTAEKY